MPGLTLVSHVLCPYVQRAAIVLAEKGVAFERRDVDLGHKPEWFLAVSPLGKTPVLMVDEQPIFESAVICEYLDETLAPRLHPDDALLRARSRGWMEFGSAVLNTLAGFYSAPERTAFEQRRKELHAHFSRLEAALGQGPFFAGASFGMVDAVFAPVFRYWEAFDRIADFGVFESLPKVRAWREKLMRRPSVRRAVVDDYAQRLLVFVRGRGGHLATLG